MASRRLMRHDLEAAGAGMPLQSVQDVQSEIYEAINWEQELFDLLPPGAVDLFLPIEAAILERDPRHLAMWLAEAIRAMSEKEVLELAKRLDRVLAAVGNGLYITTVGDIICIRGKDAIDYMANPRGRTSPIAPSVLPDPRRAVKANRWGFGF